jgi:hypothetical protein
MNFEPIINDSVNFTRDTLPGNPVRWLIFIILGLPGGLLPFVLNLNAITDKATRSVHWELIHWDQVAVLGILMLLASFFLSGYIVRIYRGGPTPPAFDQWARLFVDGIKMDVVWLIWMLPALILTLIALVSLFGIKSLGGDTAAGLGILILVLILVLAAVIMMLAAVILGTIGVIRFARTGSVMEGVNYRDILATIRSIGWWNYIIAGIIIIVIALVFGIISGILGLIPFIGWVLSLIIMPFISVFCARFLSRVYDAGMPPSVPTS